MSAEKLYSEVFEEFENASTRQQKIEVLRKYDHPRFREFLRMAFDGGIQFDVEIPNYRPAIEPAGLNFTYLDQEIIKLYRFIKNHPRRTSYIPPEKQKSLLVVVLESLHKDEAALLVNLIHKDLKIKGLTAKVVKEAFPEMAL